MMAFIRDLLLAPVEPTEMSGGWYAREPGNQAGNRRFRGAMAFLLAGALLPYAPPIAVAAPPKRPVDVGTRA
jgi:hypothetical protein